MAKFDRQRLIFGLYLIVLIVIAELVSGALKLPAWPAFIAMIFFFVEHMDVKKVSQILVGGAFGIGLIMTARPIVAALAPLMGVELARLAFIVILVYSIVAFGEIIPILFNNYAFLYLTVTAVVPEPNPLLWMGITVVGGGALIAGVIGILRLMAPRAAKQPAQSASS